MSVSYFKNNSGELSKWEGITRDERYFCFELFNCIKQNQNPFLELLSERTGNNEFKNLLKTNEFDIGVEVCFYRDLSFHHKKSNEELGLSKDFLKRTFDLALFSENSIVIIEAKAQQGFSKRQMEEFQKDRNKIKDVLKNLNLGHDYKHLEVYLIGLHSSRYKPDDVKTKSYFHSMITWRELEDKYPNSKTIFKRANDIYRK
jgi:hypothetical protein